MMKPTAERPKQAYIAARHFRKVGPRNFGCIVANIHITANTDTCVKRISALVQCLLQEYRPGTKTHHCPVNLLEIRIFTKSIIYRGYCGSPHQNNHTKVVQLVCKSCDWWAMVGEDMEPVRGMVSRIQYSCSTFTYVAESKRQVATP